MKLFFGEVHQIIKIMREFICFLFTILIVSVPGLSQTNELFQKFKQQYPDEPAVYLNRSEVLSILVEKDSLRVFSEKSEDLLILKEQAEALASRKVYGSSFSQVKNLSAKTLVWDKGRYKPMEVVDFKKNSERDRGIFFDDSYNYSFNFPAVAAQNRTLLNYTQDIKDVRFIGGFIFQTFIPQSQTSFTIKTLKGVELYHEVQNDPSKKITLSVTEKGGFVFYEWTSQNLETLKIEEDSPSIQYYAPQVVCYVKSYVNKKGKQNVISSLDDLYRWYYTFIRGLNKNTSAELKDVVKKLQAESKTEMELVKKVFYWVQDNIQYIAFEEGMRGLIPHSGTYVCEKRFGDCKDMANLIVNMLQLANVKAYHTWIGTRDIPFQYSKLPTPMVDNHMIATYISPDKKYYFLDATGDYIPFGMPTSMIQGKEALIGLDSVHYEVKIVPVISSDANVMIDSMRVSINGNYIVGSGTNSMSGYPKSFGGYQLNRTDAEDNKKYVASLLGKGSNKFFLDKYEVQHVDNKDIPTRINYEFRIGDYFQKVGSEIYVNMNFNKDYYNEFINIDSRKTPVESEYQYHQSEYIEFTVPSGYEVEYLPPNSKLENPLLGYTIEYKNEVDKIFYKKSIFSNSLLLQPVQFKEWNDAVSQISEAYKESIILKKK